LRFHQVFYDESSILVFMPVVAYITVEGSNVGSKD